MNDCGAKSKLSAPLIDLSKTGNYRYATESCGNLYAFVVERSLFLARKTGRLGLIVPHSIAATYRSNPVQTILYRELRAFYSYYSRRPGKLFDGADQCLCIVIGFRMGQDTPVLNASTTYRRWYTEERSSLFQTLAYEHIVGQYLLDQFCVFPKIGGHIETTILEKVRKQKALATVMRDTGAEFFCHRISRYFIKATDFVPYFCSERDGIKSSDDFKVYYTLNPLDARTIVAALNSSLFYWFWRVMFDGYHCGKENISAFCFEQNRLQPALSSSMEELVTKLMRSFRQNAERTTVKYKGTGVVQYDEFRIKPSKPIIDEIDCVLAQHYGFTDEELDFIINYDIKYRMG